MKMTPLKSSLLALSLILAPLPVLAAAAPGSIILAQAGEETTVPAKGAKRLDAIRKFLANDRGTAKLSAERLNQRLKKVKAFQSTNNLPDDLMQGLQREEQELTAEISRRGAAPAAEPKADAAQTGVPAADEPDVADAPADGAAPSDVAGFIRGVKPAASLQDKELRQQSKRAAQLMKTQGLQKDQRQKLRRIAREGRDELANRGKGKGKGKKPAADSTADTAPADTAAPNTETAQAAPSDVSSFLVSAKPAAGLDDKELREQTRKAMALMKSSGVSKDDRKKLKDIARGGRAELHKRGKDKAGQAMTGEPVSDTDGSGMDETLPDEEATAPPAASTGGEQKAKALIADNSDVSSMSNADGRARLDSMRELLASKEVSPESRKALRAKLAAEKTVLRGRVAKAGGTGQNNLAAIDPGATGDGAASAVNKDAIKAVAADRRPSKDLKDGELRRRVDVFRVIINDKSYSERERLEWRGFLERDRAFLRDRMLTERRRRQQDLVVGVNTGKLKIQIGLNFEPNRAPPPRAIFAAEAADDEIEEILVSPPRRAVSRRYTVEEVETSPDLRDAVARIEIDTVHFGFGEGFLREEEVGNLDRIAEIMERILAAHPGEVFMIEGHTDAVGDDAANLALSRERSAAVKEALITYFIIPPENLKTVGFGEKYLKIPTPEAEAENRRVSIARITALVGALNE